MRRRSKVSTVRVWLGIVAFAAATPFRRKQPTIPSVVDTGAGLPECEAIWQRGTTHPALPTDTNLKET